MCDRSLVEKTVDDSLRLLVNKITMDISIAKGIVLATLFFVTFFSCMLPLKLANVIRHTVDPARKLRYVCFLLKFCYISSVFSHINVIN